MMFSLKRTCTRDLPRHFHDLSMTHETKLCLSLSSAEVAAVMFDVCIPEVPGRIFSRFQRAKPCHLCHDGDAAIFRD